MTEKKASFQKNNPLHGVTLKAVLELLVQEYGWEELGRRVRVNCFVNDPNLKSSLNFLRKTSWARDKVEGLYLDTVERNESK